MSQLINSNYELDQSIKKCIETNKSVLKKLSNIELSEAAINKTINDLKETGSSVDLAPVFKKINDVTESQNKLKDDLIKDEKTFQDSLNNDLHDKFSIYTDMYKRLEKNNNELNQKLMALLGEINKNKSSLQAMIGQALSTAKEALNAAHMASSAAKQATKNSTIYNGFNHGQAKDIINVLNILCDRAETSEGIRFANMPNWSKHY